VAGDCDELPGGGVLHFELLESGPGTEAEDCDSQAKDKTFHRDSEGDKVGVEKRAEKRIAATRLRGGDFIYMNNG
jgi:hypothetical protein